MQSGEENGSLLFYDQATNTYPRVSLSEGRHIRLGRTQNAPVVPAMPEIGPETRRALDSFASARRSVYFLAFFHTHTNYPGGDSRSGDPSRDDIDTKDSAVMFWGSSGPAKATPSSAMVKPSDQTMPKRTTAFGNSIGHCKPPLKDGH
jgi:hypothetical protein